MALTFAETSAEGQEDNATAASNPAKTKRSRWATQRIQRSKAGSKRKSIIDRFHHNKHAADKKRESAGSTSTDALPDGDQDGLEQAGDGDGAAPRKVYFNLQLPSESLDENGHPITHFPRNKIRTARYTPLSFVPKNLFYQFQNIANVYFLFLIILAV